MSVEVEEHGSVQGYRQGCRGRGSCVPSFLGTCEDAMVRYRGDYAFKRAVDGGETLADLEARDVAARVADVAAVRAQNAAARAEGAPKAVPATLRRSPSTASASRTPTAGTPRTGRSRQHSSRKRRKRRGR